MDKRSFEELYLALRDEIRDYFAKQRRKYKKKIDEIIKEVKDKYVNELIEHIVERPHRVEVYSSYEEIDGIHVNVPEVVMIRAELPQDVRIELEDKLKEIANELKKINEEKSEVLTELHRWYLTMLATDSYRKPKIPKKFAKYLPKEYDVLIEKD